MSLAIENSRPQPHSQRVVTRSKQQVESLDPLAWNFGGGLTLKTDTNLQLRARYNARMTEDLFENSGTLDLRFKF